MLDNLSYISDVALFTALSGGFVIISLLAIYFVKRCIPYRSRYINNAVIGNTASLISVIYGVLAGLSALYLINNNNLAADAVQRESNAVANIYRDSKWLQDATRIDIQTELKNYITQVVNNEWPVMIEGKQLDNSNGNLIIDEITNNLINYKQSSTADSLLIHDMLDEIRLLYDARQQRIHMSYSKLSSELWVVILLGSILTLFINYFFGMDFYLHVIIVTGAALMTASMIFLLITLDRPFQ